MQCESCKAELTPEARICPACGAPTHYGEAAEPSPYHADQAPYSEQISYIDKDATGQEPSSASSQEPRPTPTPDQSDIPGGMQQAPVQGNGPGNINAEQAVSAPQQPPYPGSQPGYSAVGQPFPPQQSYPPNQPGYPAYPGYYQRGGQSFPQQPGYPYYQGMGQPAYPQSDMFQPGTQRQSHFTRNLIIGLVSALVVILLVAVAILLVEVNQSRTASVSSSYTGPITTSDPQALYSQVMSRRPTVNDPLSSTQNQTSWQTLTQGSACTFSGGALHAKGPQGAFDGCMDIADTYNNFAVQVQMTIIQGDAAGLAFRADPVGGKSYLFAITPQNAYSLSAIQNGTNSTSVQGKYLTAGNSQAINAGYNKSNQITIIARNSSIYLYINQQYLTTIDDATSSAGMVGAFVAAKSSPGDAAFSNLKIWKL
jgi:hypothetical protein